MSASPDWRAEVRRRGRSIGADLPDSMVEELAQHLEDLYEAAVTSGAPPRAAAQQARRALEHSSVTPLIPHAARNAPPHSLAAMTAFHAAVRQLGDNEQPAIDDFNSFQREQEWMAHVADAFQGAQLVRGSPLVVLAEDEFDGFGEPARRFGAPDLAEAA